MLNFPDLPAPAYPLQHEYQDTVLRSSTENGYVITRQKFTRSRKTWPSLKWKNMSQEDWQMLEDFWREDTQNGALHFEWIHPTEEITYIVRFTGPPTDFDVI